MPITIHVPAMLRGCCHGASHLSLSAANVRAALAQIEHSYAELYRNICDETGAVRRHVNLFVKCLICVTLRDGYGTGSGGRHYILPAFQRLNMPERVLLCIGTKKGLFIAEAAKTRRRFALRGPFGPGVAVYTASSTRRGAPPVRSSCNAFFA